MKVIDLFSGLRGWSAAFKDRGHEVIAVDNSHRFDADIYKDVRDLIPADFPWTPDIILASPPCEKFSVLTIGRNWNADNTPKNDAAKEALELVESTLKLIEDINPKWFVIENPRGKLRKLGVLDNLDRRTTTYCQFGEPFMKPTDLWGIFPKSLELPLPCKNGDPCHTPAGRGTKTGIKGSESSTKFRGAMMEDMRKVLSWSDERKALTALRSKVPYKLSALVCEAAEKELDESNTIQRRV